jgi:NADH-quinone oxidoreductase subunit G
MPEAAGEDFPDITPTPEGGRVRSAGAQPGELTLLAIESLYGSELLASLAPALQAVTPLPQLVLHPEDAAALQLVAGDVVRVETTLGALHLPLRLEPNQAPGMAIVPRIRGGVTGHLLPGGGAQSCKIVREEGA